MHAITPSGMPWVDARLANGNQVPQREFRERTNKYAKFVRLLRVLLPTAAVLLVVLVVLWPQLAPKQDQFRIGFANVEIANDSLNMISPRYVGTDNNNRPFSIAATSVRNLVLDGDEMVLDLPEAEITLDDGAWVMVSADSGTYRVAKKILHLFGTVRVFHDGGYTLRSSEALVNLEESSVTGSKPVIGQGPAGYIEGSGFYIDAGGTSINVLGPARMVINPSAQAPQ